MILVHCDSECFWSENNLCIKEEIELSNMECDDFKFIVNKDKQGGITMTNESKYIQYKDKRYTIFYNRTQERCINGRIENSLTIVSVNGYNIKPFQQIWDGDADIIYKTKNLIEQYLLGGGEQKKSFFESYTQWDGDLDMYINIKENENG